MIKPSAVKLVLTCLVVVCALASSAAGSSGASQASHGNSRAFAAAGTLNQYCMTCHNEKLRAGGLALTASDLSNIPARAEIWEKVIRKLRTRTMPPPGVPRPDQAGYDSLASYLENEIDTAAVAHPNPGRTEAVHRLNRTEYQNAIRDLLALDIDATALLPADDQSYGFDNIAGILKMSPTLLERYMGAAREISRLAVGASKLPP